MSGYDVFEIALRRQFATVDHGAGEGKRSLWSVEPRFIPADSDTDRHLEGQPPRIEIDRDQLNQLRTDPIAYGARLTESLFSDPGLRDLYAEAVGATVRANKKLRIRLFSDAPDVQSLWWETLQDPLAEGHQPLLFGELTPFSRYLHSLDWRNSKAGTSQLRRAAILIANPSDLQEYGTDGDLAPIDVQGELERARVGLARVDPSPIELISGAAPIQRPTLANFERALVDGVDVVYLVCHGFVATFGPELLLEDAEGGTAQVSGKDLVSIIRRIRNPPRLIVMASCQSAVAAPRNGDPTGDQSSADSGALAGLGPALCEVGVPAVVAMQDNITMETIETFIPTFFSALQADGEIDHAMNAARNAVRQRPDWHVPTLFMRFKSGRLWGAPGATGFTNWEGLVTDIDAGTAVAILGPGMTERVLGPRNEMAVAWADSYRFPLAAHAREDLPQVTQYLRVHKSEPWLRKELRHHIRSEITRRYVRVLEPYARAEQANTAAWDDDNTANLVNQWAKQKPIDDLLAIATEGEWREEPEPHSILAELPFRVYITAHPSSLIIRALLNARLDGKTRDPQVAYCKWRETDDYRQEIPWPTSPWDADSAEIGEPEATVERPLVFRLFGELGIEGSVVLTEDDYLDYLIAVQHDSQLIPNLVHHAFARHSLLFLGFRMDDWDFRVLLRSIVSKQGGEARGRLKNIAVQIDPEEGRTLAPDRARSYLEEYFGAVQVDLYWGSTDHFLQELRVKYPEITRR